MSEKAIFILEFFSKGLKIFDSLTNVINLTTTNCLHEELTKIEIQSKILIQFIALSVSKGAI